MAPPVSPQKLVGQTANLFAKEIEGFLSDLKNLSCGPRKDGDSKELQLIRRELAERDLRIGRLESTLQQREEARLALIQQHDSLRQQLEEARSLVQRVEASRIARQEAEAHAHSVLEGSPSTKQLLAKELQELQEAEDRAREAREARRKAALERKAALDAELSSLRQAAVTASVKGLLEQLPSAERDQVLKAL